MAKPAPLISIVMPNYNNEKFLPETIRSIQKQTISDYELIICHDSSEDNSLKVIKAFAAKDWRIKVMASNTKSNCYHAYNRGIDNARGKYLAIMDSDNIMASELLQKELSFLENNPSVDFVSCTYQSFGRYHKLLKKPASHKHIAVKLLRGCHFNNAMMVRREFLDKTGLRYDENFSIAGDYDLFLRALLHKQHPVKFAILDFIGIYYRVHDDNVSCSMDTRDKHYQERTTICQRASEKLYPKGQNHEMLAAILQYHMNANFIKPRGTVSADYISMKNLVLWRDATIGGLLQYQDIDQAFLCRYFNKSILKMMAKNVFHRFFGRKR
ncbi:MAG: glycosyltransferase family 2 protein [Candidatus Porifericomitaceae bacterium WSBS_2022_MAG_OTU9]